jgi:site-specific DNA recombinase
MSASILPNSKAERQSSLPGPQVTQGRAGAIYVRISRPDPHDQSYFPETQLASCLTAAAKDGVTVPAQYIFRAQYTGTSLNRPDLQSFRGVITSRLVQDVYVHDIDRLARKLAFQLLLKDECEQAGVVFHDVSMPLDDRTPEGRMLADMRGVFAESERYKIQERTTRGRNGRAKVSVPNWWHAVPPYNRS